jgi:hypothetical protein
MAGATEKFGAFIRREREAKELGLREMAKKIGVSPTYLSKSSATSSRRPLRTSRLIFISPSHSRLESPNRDSAKVIPLAIRFSALKLTFS